VNPFHDKKKTMQLQVQLTEINFVMIAEKIGSETLSQIVQMVNSASSRAPIQKIMTE
jgi:hypothetical protein